LAGKFDLAIVQVGVPVVLVREEQRVHLPPEVRDEAIVAQSADDVFG